ncbi:MAG TPA: HEAT repeat domain-containing protein [Ohtaekwangia sp.]|uniref:HEAT repeat domain-containing protein n=1 Tax=Ohtaekwangia sp. TaxID=2066019 RepID=UPI002F94FB92
MERTTIDALLVKYRAGQTNAEDVRTIEQWLEEGVIDLSDLEDMQQLQNQIMQAASPMPSLELDDKFYRMLALEKKSSKAFSWKQFFAWPDLLPRLAFASVALLAGLAVGFWIRPSTDASGNGNDGEIALLSQQVTDLKEMMMLSLLEKESATERLKAVSLTQEMDQVSNKVTSALIETLNNDSNVNVRLAALDVLKGYARNSEVREALIRSIARQQSPLVQVELAELMAALQVKSSVKELEKLLQDKKTPQEVKKKIQESIQVIS